MTKSNKSRKFIATSATAALVASAIVPVASAAQINDFNSISSFAQEAVQDLNDRGIIKGDQKGNFNPRNNVTRAEAATILTNALGLEGSGSTSFNDVKKNAWYYDAIDAAVANGIFQGQGAGKFNPSGNLTRSEAAIILVDAFGLEGSADLSQFKDSASVKTWAQEALEIAVANEVMKGDAGNLKPNAPISRQEFAVMYSRTEALEVAEEVSANVKAINNTTVEVTFEDTVADIKALDFAIEGLTISNAVVKQTDSKTVVLTTSAQTADVEYTVTVNEEVIGKFKGVSAVIPTAVKITEQSLQAQVGAQVTLKAQVEVAAGQSKAGIPVTFNIVNNASITTATLNQPIVAEATTDENGVATYTYTRYAQTSFQLASHDEVQAYATGNATARSFSKVYWANIQPLAITEVTAGNTVTNGGKKVYKVKAALGHAEPVLGANGAHLKDAAGNLRYKVNVGYRENINVTPDKAIKTVDVIDSKGTNLSYPGQFTSSTTGSNNLNSFVKEVELELDANGEAVFTLSGSNATITPFVFVDQKVNPTNAAGSEGRFEATELFADAAKVTFSKVQTLGLALESVGVQYAASFLDNDNNHLADSLESIAVDGSKTFTKDALKAALVNTGGRDYKATLTDKNGKTAPAGTEVKVEIKIGSALKTNGGAVYVVDNNTRKVTKLTNDASTPVAGFEKTANLTTDSKGAVSFTLIGYKDAYATPTVYVESGDKAGLDKNDLQQTGEIVYFSDAVVKTASLTVDEKSVPATDSVEYTYSTVDQNGKAYRPANTSANYYVTFEVSTTFNPVNVTVGTGTFAHGSVAGEVGQGSTSTGTFVVRTNDQGVASIKVSSKNGIATSVNVVASASDASLPQLLTASNEFTTYSTKDLHAKVESVNATNNTVVVSDKDSKRYTYNYTDGRLQINGTDAVSEAAFEAALTAAITNANQSLSIKLVDGVYVFNVLTTTPPPTVANSQITKVEITGADQLTVTFSHNVTVGNPIEASQFTFDFNNNGTIEANEIATGYAVAGNSTKELVINFASGTFAAQPTTAVGTFTYSPSIVEAERIKVGGSYVNAKLTSAVTTAAQASGITTTHDTASVTGADFTQLVAKAQIVAVSDITQAGNVVVTLNGTELTTGTVTLNVAVEMNDTQEVVAGKVRAALAGNSNVNTKYNVTGTGAEIIVTPKAVTDVDNESNTLALNVTNGTALGLGTTTTVGSKAGQVGRVAKATIQVLSGVTPATGSVKPLSIRVKQTTTANPVGFDTIVTVNVAAGDTADKVAAKVEAALKASLGATFDVTTVTDTVTLTNKATGSVITTIVVTP